MKNYYVQNSKYVCAYIFWDNNLCHHMSYGKVHLLLGHPSPSRTTRIYESFFIIYHKQNFHDTNFIEIDPIIQK